MKPGTNPSLMRILSRSGRVLSQCGCGKCQAQCRTVPGLATPSQILDLIAAGHGPDVVASVWYVGVIAGAESKPVPMYQLRYDNRGCHFLVDGKCALHARGLKPIECSLSHHSHLPRFNIRKSLSWLVSREWLRPEQMPVIAEIEDRLGISPGARITPKPGAGP